MFAAHLLDTETVRELQQRGADAGAHAPSHGAPAGDDAAVRWIGLSIGLAACAAIVFFAWWQVGL
jgi:hypothetical protein